MEPDKNKAPDGQSPEGEQAPNTPPQAPADALSRTPEDLQEEQAAQEAANPTPASNEPPEKKVSGFKKLLKKINLYILIFGLLVVVAVVIAVVNFLNSQKEPEAPTIESQQLTTEALRELANNDASVGNSNQTLTIQGNAVIAGQTLIRANLNVAGTLQTGGNITAPGITISGTSNLGETQVNSLQVANNVAIEGSTTLRDLNVAGTSSFGGAMTASQITVTRLILSGNASLQVPNHISFPGASPARTINAGVLGNGGSASVNGSDTAGTININTGGNPTAGCLVRITFQQSFTNQPHVNITPVGSGAGKLQYYVDRNTTGFSVCTNNASPASSSFAFDYFVTN